MTTFFIRSKSPQHDAPAYHVVLAVDAEEAKLKLMRYLGADMDASVRVLMDNGTSTVSTHDVLSLAELQKIGEGDVFAIELM